MASKTELLQYFSTLDLATLERLEKYSKLLIIPDEDLLINATMLQMVEKAHELADSLFPEWTDRSKSDFGEFLVELFALFSEKDFWYINAFANEGILQKMRSYSNAFSKASSLGYTPILCHGASASFAVTFAAGNAMEYARGELVVKVGERKYSNDSPISVPLSAAPTTQSVTLHEGEQVAEEVTFNGYCCFLRKKNIDVASLSVSLGGVQYTQVKNFGDSNADSTHFMVLPEEDGSCSIFFGQNGFGVTPAIGTSVHVEYRTCNGTDGNQTIGAVSILSSVYERPATAATMSSVASGGTFAESLTAIKQKAPLMFNSHRAAINEAATRDIINGIPTVHQCMVYQLADDVVYEAIPASGAAELTLAEQDAIQAEVEPLLMLGYSLQYAANQYKTLKTAANPSASKIVLGVVASVGYDPAGIATAVRAVMEDLTNPLIEATYGGSFTKVDADAKIRARVAGVQSVAFFVRVDGVDSVMSDIQLGDKEIFSKIVQADLEINVTTV